MRNITFGNNEYYHVYNRGVDKRNIFIDDADRKRFYRYLVAYNDNGEGLPLVRLMCYAFMPNHFHFLLEQLIEGGISSYLHKIGLSYASYFNKKYDRSGHLFAGRFNAKHVNTDAYLLHLSRYIHLNPLDLQQPGWKETGLLDTSSADIFLRNYRWSSYRHYLKLRWEPAVDEGIMASLFTGPVDYQIFISEWLDQDFATSRPGLDRDLADGSPDERTHLLLP